ncbi:MAG TPA: hypothetical protein GX700_12875 [Paracoccus sp.]|nr:hypothetical protein [Paracoccus sp. (in: a-proteobacteria)]
MSLPIRLETFRRPEEPPVPGGQRLAEIEEIKLQAYERGFVAGWEDSSRQAEREALERRAGVEQQLAALSFTYHDARGHVLRALEPVLSAMLETLIPEAARAAVIPQIIAHLLPLAQGVSEAPVSLRIAPGSRDDCAAALSGLVLPPLEIIECAELGPGQAGIGFDQKEIQVDLAQAAQELRSAISRFYQLQPEENRHA